MSKYEITPLNSNKTILQIVKGIEKYLHDNQIYKVFGYNGNYDAETELYDIDDLYTEEQLKTDDVVLFNNCYLGIVDAVGTNSFSVKDVINFRGEKGDTGATGEKGEKGDKGDTGETGATGQTGATGNGIASIVKTGTSGLVDTYTITFTDGSTFTYNVTNGQDGSSSTTTYTNVNTFLAFLYNNYSKILNAEFDMTIDTTNVASMQAYKNGVEISNTFPSTLKIGGRFLGGSTSGNGTQFRFTFQVFTNDYNGYLIGYNFTGTSANHINDVKVTLNISVSNKTLGQVWVGFVANDGDFYYSRVNAKIDNITAFTGNITRG